MAKKRSVPNGNRGSSSRRLTRSSRQRVSYDAVDSNDDRVNRYCRNCHRTGVEIHPVHSGVSFRRRFCQLKKFQRGGSNRYSYLMCEECTVYLCDEKGGTIESAVWPSFIWHVLSSYDVKTATSMMAMLPVEWQKWWEKSVCNVHPSLSFATLNVCTADITKLRDECECHLVVGNASADNMKDCSWTQFVLLVESCLTIPIVRCPWGCSEFVGSSTLNLLPFDVVVQNFIDRSLPMYSRASDCFKAKQYGFRRDLFEGCGFPIMGNKKWLCRPSIILRQGIPYFMACRFHTTKDLGKYIHPPRHPTGSVAFSADDSKAQVVAVPRTIASFKKHKCSNSYSIKKVCGNYSGIDSLNLCSYGPIRDWNFVSQRRHLLSLACRSECGDMVADYIGLKSVDQQDVNRSVELFGRDICVSLMEKYGVGATYVDLEDVLKTQDRLKRQSVRRVRMQVVAPNGNVNDETVSFRPVWSNRQLPVKEFNNSIGCTFPCFKAGSKELKKDNDMCVAIFLMWNILHMVPEVWNCVDNSIQNNDVWYGWVLQYLSIDLLAYKGRKKRGRGHPFFIKENGMNDLSKAINTFSSQCSVSATLVRFHGVQEILYNAFNGISDTTIIGSRNIPSNDIIGGKNVIVVLMELSDDLNHFPCLEIPGYELRIMGCKNLVVDDTRCSIFARHKGLSDVWRYDRLNNAHVDFTRVENGFSYPILRTHIVDWRVLVFVKMSDPNYEEMKCNLLRLQGGQDVVWCEEHNNCPFVVLPILGRFTGHSCRCSIVECNRKQYYGCPVKECRRGICHNHLKEKVQAGCRVYIGGLSLDAVVQLESVEEDGVFSYSEDSSYIGEDDEFDEFDGCTSGNSDTSSLRSDCDMEEDETAVEDNVSDCLSSHRSEAEERSLGDIIDIVNDLDYSSSDQSLDSDYSSENADMAKTGEEEEDEYPVIPVTSCVKQPIYFDLSHLIEAGDAIPNHVLLNTHGNCLIRRKRKLTATKRCRHFLERLACVSKGKNIPLLYPEGMMFPSIFWMRHEEGALVGTIPCCALMDNKTLDNLGLASLYAHSRTRLLDPTLPTSTNVRYLSFLWDMAANLGLRGCSATLVFNRGFSDMMNNEGLKVESEDPRLFDYHQIDSRTTVNQLAAASARNPNDFFFTWTMNGLKTPGVRIIFDWCRSGCALQEFSQDLFCGVFQGLSDVNTLGGGFDMEEEHFLSNGVEEAFGIFVVRAWMEFIPQFLYYLQYGRDSPFKDVAGGVRHMWNHSEIQNNQDGNAPHNHTLIYMRDPPENEDQVLRLCSMIRASMETFCGDVELNTLKRKGLLENYRIHRTFFDDDAFINDVKVLLTHHCTKRCVVVTRQIYEGGEEHVVTTRKCKGADYRLMNPEPSCHNFIPIPVKHEEEAVRVMVEVGMMEPFGGDSVRFRDPQIRPTKEFQKQLTAVRHCPPSYTRGYLFSPANPVLFAMLLSSMNLQFVTAYILMRYLVKYCASVDKGNHLRFKSKKDRGGCIEIQSREGLNTKITRNAIYQKRKDQKERKQGVVDGRSLSLAEMVMQFLRYPRITTTFRFEDIPTGPMGMRTTVRTRGPGVRKLEGRYGVLENPRRVQDVNVRQIFAGFAARKQLNFPSNRQFDKYQVVTFADSLFQSSSIDKVTQFSLRPPELSFVMSYPKYHIWFKRSDKKFEVFTKGDPYEQCKFLMDMLDKEYEDCPWIDAFGYHMRVRWPAVSKITKLLRNIRSLLNEAHERGKNMLSRCFGGDLMLFRKVLDLFEILDQPVGVRSYTQKRKVLVSRFVCEMDDYNRECPVYWFRTVRASRGEDFLYHLLLSMGQFKSEYEIYSQGCLKNAFVYCGLIPEDSDHELRSGVLDLIRRYAKHQLCSYPLGTKSFDKELVSAYQLLTSYLMEGKLPNNELPPALYTNLRDFAEEDAVDYLNVCKRKLITSYCTYLQPLFEHRIIPCTGDILDASVSNCVDFDISVLGVGNESTALAAEEHFRGRCLVMAAVSHYKAATLYRTRSVCLVGAGGVGKTVDLRLAGLYCCCQGLYVLSTSLTGKRSAETAGEHIHVRFQVPVNERLNVAQMADRCYTSLLKDGKRLIALKRVDVLLIDEMGQLSVKLLACLDYLMRRIRHSSHWMGGVLVITTMDVKQLKPIRGLPPIFSPAMLTSFDYVEYTVPLRTHDLVLMEIQQITRMTTSELQEEGVRERFMELAGGDDGFHFVSEDDLSDLPTGPEVTYCYAHHEPCVKTEKRILNNMKIKYGKQGTRTRESNDWEETTTQQYPAAATASTRRELDRQAGSSRVLLFYPYATFTVTYNDTKEGKFFNGQLCMILDELPDQDDLDEWRAVYVYRAPHGVDEVPSYEGNQPDYTEQQLLSSGWEKVAISRDPSAKDKVLLTGKGSSAYREQYGLRHRVSVTIHSVMGSTLGKLISRIDDCVDGMWESGMAVVLLSRTRRARDVYFIGSKKKTLDVLWLTLLKGGQYNDTCQHLLQCLTNGGQGRSRPRFISPPPGESSFFPVEAMLPIDGEYVVYLIVSLKDTTATYTGYSKRLRRRLNSHNSSAGGSSGTGGVHRELAPWGLLCYVQGFAEKKEAMSFEGDWKAAIQYAQIQSGGRLTSMDKCMLADTCIKEDKYTIVYCGEIRPHG